MDDLSAVTQLVLRERQGRDRGWWAQMADSFAADSAVDISWFRGTGAQFAERSKAMAARGDQAVHRNSPPVIHVVEDRAIVELPTGVELRIDVDGVQADLTSYTRILYRAQRRESAWSLVAMTAVYERDTLVPALPGQPLRLDPTVIAAYRPSYALLAWHLERRGYPISQDLPGDDLPAQVEAVYTAAFAWLHGADAAPQHPALEE